MFFNVNEKTLADIIANQQKREQEQLKEAAEKAKNEVEYQGHKLTFLVCVDGKIAIDSDPPLVKEVEGDKDAIAGPVDILTAHGWVRKPE